MAKTKSKRERQERRFFPHSAANTKVIAVVGGVGALLAGAGAYGYLGTIHLESLQKIVPWLLAGGAALMGGAFWFGTSGEPPLRVGDGGIATDRGKDVRRMPWYGVESLTFDEGSGTVMAQGKDDTSAPFTVKASLKVNPQAAAWMVREAKERVAKVVEVSASAEERLPETRDDDGEILKLEPVQVVGKHCAASGKIISFEPDARVCSRCDRVYHKNSVPKRCACGASLSGKGKGDEDAA